ncbi:uncharacterized protein METZ01_LOCUS456132, partial [marine metagenome]
VWNLNPSEFFRYRGDLLNIEKLESFGPHMFRQSRDADLSGIGDPVEHRFGHKRSPDMDSVEPSHEFPVEIRFHRVGESHLVQFDIYFLDLMGDPGLVSLCTRVNDPRQ